MQSDAPAPERGIAARGHGVVLVTGACGFVGRYCVRRLAAAGYSVVGVGRSALAPDATLPIWRYRPLDLGDPHSVEALVTAGGSVVEAIVHLAAVFPGSLQAADATAFGERNLRMDEHVLRASERLRCRVVFASTASVYPTDSPEPNREDGPTLENQPYAREKLMTEHEGLRRLNQQGSAFASLRITAPYGAGQTARTVMRVFLERAMHSEPVQFHGTGRREQDFVHADDVADAAVCAVNCHAHGIFNVAAGSSVTMKELAMLVVRSVPRCCSTVGPSGVEDRQETRYARFSIAKAAGHLGWMPRVTLTEGVAHWAQELLRDRDARGVPV